MVGGRWSLELPWMMTTERPLFSKLARHSLPGMVPSNAYRDEKFPFASIDAAVPDNQMTKSMRLTPLEPWWQQPDAKAGRRRSDAPRL